MNYGDLKSHFNDLLNRSDITPTLTTRFIDQSCQDTTTAADSMSERVLTSQSGETNSLTAV